MKCNELFFVALITSYNEDFKIIAFRGNLWNRTHTLEYKQKHYPATHTVSTLALVCLQTVVYQT